MTDTLEEGKGIVLVVEDEPTSRTLISRWLEREGYEVVPCETAEDAFAALTKIIPDVIFLDLELPGVNGLAALDQIVVRHPRIPVAMLTANREVETVVAAMQKGAYDYIGKPVEKTKLLMVARNAIEKHRLLERVSDLEISRAPRDRGLIGRAPAMIALDREIERVAATDVTVLIQGESGTGKELVARAIHNQSGRKGGPFVAINCATIPETLQESELFGHEKGAFTGANANYKGRFELANGGTLFLDELGELSLSAQAKLLRVLQERVFRRVGGTNDLRSDFRLIAATHRDLASMIEAHSFREDLYFRVAVFELSLPSLRERMSDIPLLLRHFLEKAGKPNVTIAPDAERIFMSYVWPGNVRELENTVQRSIVLMKDNCITVECLPQRLREGQKPLEASQTNAQVATATVAGEENIPTLDIHNIKRRALESALLRTNGNMTEAVKLLGIGRTTAYRLLKRDPTS